MKKMPMKKMPEKKMPAKKIPMATKMRGTGMPMMQMKRQPRMMASKKTLRQQGEMARAKGRRECM
ncbi:MAG: hypothetical protein NUW01_06650 [Gemmatimonadaceae bacterium]|nr:hypothetical protein [Gemmatimonadaceae bacterium]